MFKGEVVSINIAGKEGAPTRPVDKVRAVPGKGLEGDRYYNMAVSGEREIKPKQELTLIEIEAIDALARELDFTIDAKDARRNIVTRGVPLNHLVGRNFKIGKVVAHGIKLAEPCQGLADMTDQKIFKGLIHRGGLRAQILEEGVIRTGDKIEVAR